MNIKYLLLIDVIIILLGVAIVYSDLWMRDDKPTRIDWRLFSYRPFYVVDSETIEGAWTVDLFQVSIVLAIIIDVVLMVYPKTVIE